MTKSSIFTFQLGNQTTTQVESVSSVGAALFCTIIYDAGTKKIKVDFDSNASATVGSSLKY